MCNYLRPWMVLDSTLWNRGRSLSNNNLLICNDGANVLNPIQNDKDTCPLFIPDKSDCSFIDNGHSIPIGPK